MMPEVFIILTVQATSQKNLLARQCCMDTMIFSSIFCKVGGCTKHRINTSSQKKTTPTTLINVIESEPPQTKNITLQTASTFSQKKQNHGKSSRVSLLKPRNTLPGEAKMRQFRQRSVVRFG